MIQDDKNYSNEKNFVRDDWGGQVLTPNTGNPGEVNQRQDVNGSTNKPYPQERNWTRKDDPDGRILESREEKDLLHQPGKEPFGQVKYARREGAPSIYKDASRNTADDNAATIKAEKRGSLFEPEVEEEEGGSASV